MSTKPTDPIWIFTLDDGGKSIDRGSSNPMVFAANEIAKIITEACADKQTASMTEDVCAYKLKFLIGSAFPIMPGSVIEI